MFLKIKVNEHRPMQVFRKSEIVFIGTNDQFVIIDDEHVFIKTITLNVKSQPRHLVIGRYPDNYDVASIVEKLVEAIAKSEENEVLYFEMPEGQIVLSREAHQDFRRERGLRGYDE